MRANKVYLDLGLIYIENKLDLGFSIVINDKEVGLATIKPLSIMKGVELTDFGIHEEYRQKGCARRLSEILKSMYGEVHIEVLEINEVAFNSFSRIGYKLESFSESRKVNYMSYGAQVKFINLNDVKKKDEQKDVKDIRDIAMKDCGGDVVPQKLPIQYL